VRQSINVLFFLKKLLNDIHNHHHQTLTGKNKNKMAAAVAIFFSQIDY